MQIEVEKTTIQAFKKYAVSIFPDKLHKLNNNFLIQTFELLICAPTKGLWWALFQVNKVNKPQTTEAGYHAICHIGGDFDVE